ncbi:MAG: primosomal protein N' [Phycisphaerales bacterium]|nr:primosomal protein N' [Phycisphaerales bacterium]
MSRLLPFSNLSTEDAAAYVSVAVERGIDRVGEGSELLYAVPRKMAEPALVVGERVDVPLGRQTAAGIVVGVGGEEMLGDLDPIKVRSIAARTGAGLTASLVELAKWMSGYYVCPLGMTLATMMPAAVKKDVGKREQKVLALTELENSRRAEIAALVGKPARAVWEKIVAEDALAMPLPPLELKGLLGERTMRSINRLVAAGLLEERTREIIRAGESLALGNANAFGSAKAITPTADQQRVIDGIREKVERPAFGVHLLYGVTGSGKTELYLRLIRAMLDANEDRSAIVLVPEIALTPQTAERFLERFADRGVAVLHSGLTAAQRNKEWTRVATGAARVVVGARSALFAPVGKLGLIVVDEEHDSSYKQDQLPRYHARDAAIKRAQLEGCPILLGSGTPSLESWQNAASGKFTLWKLLQRVGGGRLPTIRVVDMLVERQEARKQGLGDVNLGPTLRKELQTTLRAGASAILLLNRRGYATYVGCAGGASCGWSLYCDRCDAKMIVHRDKTLRAGELVRCHHCLSESVLPGKCPQCSRGIVRLGAGTQRVEEEVASLLSDAGVDPTALVRVDRDTMKTASDYFGALESFAQGRSRVMLGTQMIAKGLDFPGVRLVGVISADTGLYLPDFRADERTFQLLSQVAGRAGRADAAGTVIIQTADPTNRAIVFASEHGFERFASEELKLRRMSSLPPWSRFARIVCRDEKPAAVQSRCEEIVKFLRETPAGESGELRVFGPLLPAIPRVADQHRLSIEMHAGRAGAVQAALSTAREAGLLKSDAKTAIDVDPVSVL